MAASTLSDEYSDISLEDGSPESKIRAKSIQNYISNSFKDDTLTDFTIVVDNKEIKVHKFVLSMGSSVFKAMFERDYKENAENKVVVKDCLYDIMMQMLEYIYTGYAAKIEEMPNKLLTISQKYDIKILKRKCEKALIPTLCRKNVLEILVLADGNKAESLEKAAIEFIMKHYSEIRETEDWKELCEQHQHLHEKITDASLNYSPSKKKVKPDEK